MSIVPGNALYQTIPGAASRPDHPASSRPQIGENSAHARGSLVVDRDADQHRNRPVLQAAPSERPRADLPRGSLVDIRV